MERSASATGVLPRIVTAYLALTTSRILAHDCWVPAAVLGHVVRIPHPLCQHNHRCCCVICHMIALHKTL